MKNLFQQGLPDGLCSDTTNCIEVLLDGVSQLVVGSMQFAVYPNPADENITIEFSKACNNCRIEINNTLGQILYTEIIKDKVESINLSTISTGIYFVKIVTPDGFLSVKKIVRE